MPLAAKEYTPEELDALEAQAKQRPVYDQIAGGVVLTGGGCYLPGVQELAEEVFELPVRLGLPQNISGVRDVTRNPAYASAVGLLAYGRQFQPPRESRSEGGAGYWIERVSQWFKGNF